MDGTGNEHHVYYWGIQVSGQSVQSCMINAFIQSTAKPEFGSPHTGEENIRPSDLCANLRKNIYKLKQYSFYHLVLNPHKMTQLVRS